jgi:prepilin-type N-terminal cleavage/methylation domain-containing protein
MHGEAMHGAADDASGRRGGRGFTLLELIVVIAVIGILAAIAMPAMKNVPRRANESVLKTNLRTMRDVIDQFLGDKGHYPPSLEALVDEGYLRAIPIDPITKSSDTWVVIYEEEDPDNPPAETEVPEGGEPGIIDVRSGSTATALDGTPYSEW